MSDMRNFIFNTGLAFQTFDLADRAAQTVSCGEARLAAVQRLRVTMHKPHAPFTVTFDHVDASIQRSRHG
jgi:dihydroneopterin aldolase